MTDQPATAELQVSDRLVERALYLCMYGESAPGAESETWTVWARDAETYLRQETDRRDQRQNIEREVLAEAMDYFMAHEGATHVVDALARRRETRMWPDAD